MENRTIYFALDNIRFFDGSCNGQLIRDTETEEDRISSDETTTSAPMTNPTTVPTTTATEGATNPTDECNLLRSTLIHLIDPFSSSEDEFGIDSRPVVGFGYSSSSDHYPCCFLLHAPGQEVQPFCPTGHCSSIKRHTQFYRRYSPLKLLEYELADRINMHRQNTRSLFLPCLSM